MPVLVIIWFILLFIFDIFVIYWFFRKKILKDKCDETIDIIPKLGNKISVNGPTGSGKTTTCAGIILSLTIYLYNEISRRMDDIRLSLPDIDFNILEKLFDEKYPLFADKELGESLCIDYVLSAIPEDMLNTFYTDFLSLQSKRDMIIDYFLYYWVYKYRAVELYSTGFFYNFVSGKLSKRLDPSSSHLRSMAAKRNYQGGFCTIKFNDETSISSGNEKSNNTEARNSGVRDYLALKRHEGKGTCFDISPSQIAIDVEAQQRRQNNINIEIYDRCDSLADFKITRKILQTVLKIVYIPIWIKLRFKAIFNHLDFEEVKITYSKKSSKYRKFESFIDKICKLLKRQGYIRVRCKAYYSADDVGKKNPEYYDKYVFYFPIYYCYGVIDTYEYAPVMKHYSEMNENSINDKISQFDKESKIDLFEKTISK